MTVIKNTDELVKTAKEHKLADHIRNNFYAKIQGKHNGERVEDWSVCAIGCLATPATLEELKKEYPDNVNTYEEKVGDEIYTHYSCDIDDDVLLYKLEEKYGITYILARAAETFFEGKTKTYNNILDYYEEEFILKNDEIANWPLQFAEALQKIEGVEVTDDMVRNWFYDAEIRLEVNSEYAHGQHLDFLDWLVSLKD